MRRWAFWIIILPWAGCMSKAPLRKPAVPPAPHVSLESHLLGTWELRGRDGKLKEMIFAPNGSLTFRNGLEYYNPAEWTLIESRHELILTLLHAPDEKLDLKQLWDGIQVFRRFYELMGGMAV